MLGGVLQSSNFFAEYKSDHAIVPGSELESFNDD